MRAILDGSAGMVGVATFGIVTVLAMLTLTSRLEATKRRWRQRFSRVPLGLVVRTSKKKPRPHAILAVQPFGGVREWIDQLPRGPRRTLRVQTDQAFGKHAITLTTRPSAASLGYEHVRVAVAHQARLSGPARSALGGVFRCLVGWLMAGVVDEYRDGDGKLLAWCQMVAKGKTIRAMWYYADPAADRHCIWFYSVRLSVARALALGLGHVDLGPSGSQKVAELKKSYGFDVVADWSDVLDYSGGYIDLATLDLDDTAKKTHNHARLRTAVAPPTPADGAQLRSRQRKLEPRGERCYGPAAAGTGTVRALLADATELTATEKERWQQLHDDGARLPKLAGRPSPTAMTQLKAHKAALKAFLSSLRPEAKREAKQLHVTAKRLAAKMIPSL